MLCLNITFQPPKPAKKSYDKKTTYSSQIKKKSVWASDSSDDDELYSQVIFFIIDFTRIIFFR